MVKDGSELILHSQTELAYIPTGEDMVVSLFKVVYYPVSQSPFSALFVASSSHHVGHCSFDAQFSCGEPLRALRLILRQR
jgi:hypothetical protein